MRELLSILLLSPLVLVGVSSANAQPKTASSDARVLETVRVPSASITLDGRPSEAAWDRVPVVSDFTQQEPVEGGAPSQRTEIRIFHTSTHLYIGATLYYADPGNITANRRQRDAGLGADDRLLWTLDTYNDGRTAYFFETNPEGLRGDGLLTTGQGSSINKSWDGIWDAEVHRNSQGWTAEIRIPFRTLQYDPTQTTWGINFQRTIRRRNEEVLWSGYKRDQGIFRPRFAGELRGLEGLSKGLGVEVTPYGIAKANREWSRSGVETTPNVEFGGEVGYAITPTLQSAVTINTDFAEVESDRRRVNLTRFPLFFPEKRDFFLEASSVFTFAPSSAQYPFFSRRIGLVGGESVPILAGARLNGRVGNYNVGFFQVRTQETLGVPADSLTVPAEDFTAARVVRSFGAGGQVGLIYTRRASHAEDGQRFDRFQNRHTIGADLELSTSRLFGDKNLEFQAFFVGHNTPLRADTSTLGHRTTRGLRLNYPNDPWTAHMSYREFGNAYDPAVGFVGRRGFRRLQPSAGYEPFLEDHPWIRSLEFSTRFEYLTDLQGTPQTVSIGVQPFGIILDSGDSFEVSGRRLFERLNGPFDILGDGELVLPPGTYVTYTGALEFRTASYRPISGDFQLTYGGFWSGTQAELETGVTARPLTGLTFTADWEYTTATLDQGSLETHVLRLDGTYSPTPDLSVSTRIQFDNVSNRLGLFARARWIPRPGSDLFLVLTRNWRRKGGRLSPLNSEVATKLTYSIRF
jgi:hypothetical protein